MHKVRCWISGRWRFLPKLKNNNSLTTCYWIRTSDQVIKWTGSTNRKSIWCGQDGTCDHVLFKCIIARFIWSVIRETTSCTWNPVRFANLHLFLWESWKWRTNSLDGFCGDCLGLMDDPRQCFNRVAIYKTLSLHSVINCDSVATLETAGTTAGPTSAWLVHQQPSGQLLEPSWHITTERH